MKERVDRLHKLLGNDANNSRAKQFITSVIKFCENCDYGLLNLSIATSSSDDDTNKNKNKNKARIECMKRSIPISKEERYNAFWDVLKVFGELYFSFLSSNYLDN